MKQGPRWEALVVSTLQLLGLTAKRIDKSGENGVSDVQVGEPNKDSPVFLAWKRYLTKGGPRRSTVSVVAMDFQTWVELVEAAGWTDFYVECKATQTLSVTSELRDATRKVRKDG